LSLEQGGGVPGHASHRSGRDADALFYLLDEHGNPRDGALIPLDPQGNGTDYGNLADPTDDILVRLDVARTWRYVVSLLEQPGARVQRLFVAEHLRSLLLAHAHAVGTAALLVERFRMVACQPASPHDDHLHVRIYCPEDDIRAGCRDSPPIQSWRQQELAQVQLKATLAGPQRGPSPREEPHAEVPASSMHSSVLQFLIKRQSWLARGRRAGGCY
jgi:penicillin-insensitive murein endopeptidase